MLLRTAPKTGNAGQKLLLAGRVKRGDGVLEEVLDVDAHELVLRVRVIRRARVVAALDGNAVRTPGAFLLGDVRLPPGRHHHARRRVQHEHRGDGRVATLSHVDDCFTDPLPGVAHGDTGVRTPTDRQLGLPCRVEGIPRR